MEFFGIPISDDILLEARPDQVLATGRRFVDSNVYDDHLHRLSTGNRKQILQSYFEVLAGLEIQVQDECFEALVNDLNETHVVERLREGKVYKGHTSKLP